MIIYIYNGTCTLQLGVGFRILKFEFEMDVVRNFFHEVEINIEKINKYRNNLSYKKKLNTHTFSFILS